MSEFQQIVDLALKKGLSLDQTQKLIKARRFLNPWFLEPKPAAPIGAGLSGLLTGLLYSPQLNEGEDEYFSDLDMQSDLENFWSGGPLPPWIGKP